MKWISSQYIYEISKQLPDAALNLEFTPYHQPPPPPPPPLSATSATAITALSDIKDNDNVTTFSPPAFDYVNKFSLDQPSSTVTTLACTPSVELDGDALLQILTSESNAVDVHREKMYFTAWLKQKHLNGQS